MGYVYTDLAGAELCPTRAKMTQPLWAEAIGGINFGLGWKTLSICVFLGCRERVERVKEV